MICKVHPTYKASKQPRCECLPCWEMWLDVTRKRTFEAVNTLNKVLPDFEHAKRCVDILSGAKRPRAADRCITSGKPNGIRGRNKGSKES